MKIVWSMSKTTLRVATYNSDKDTIFMYPFAVPFDSPAEANIDALIRSWSMTLVHELSHWADENLSPETGHTAATARVTGWDVVLIELWEYF